MEPLAEPQPEALAPSPAVTADGASVAAAPNPGASRGAVIAAVIFLAVVAFGVAQAVLDQDNPNRRWDLATPARGGPALEPLEATYPAGEDGAPLR